MAKETYYFSHDFDPTGDPKMSAMIGEYGAIGYGIFWRIAEMLHADKNHTLPLKKYLYQAIAKQLLNSCKQMLVIEDLPQFVEMFIKDCIETFELFNLDGECFSSNRVFRHFEKKRNISELRSEIGKKGAIAKQNKILPQSKKQILTKESKVKESIIIKKDLEKYPKADLFNGLPEIKIGASKELFKAQGINATTQQIESLWNVFKVQNLTGENYYQSEDKVYGHFINWVKTQKISSTIDKTNKNSFI